MTFELSHTEVSTLRHRGRATFDRSWLPWLSLLPKEPLFTLFIGNLPYIWVQSGRNRAFLSKKEFKGTAPFIPSCCLYVCMYKLNLFGKTLAKNSHVLVAVLWSSSVANYIQQWLFKPTISCTFDEQMNRRNAKIWPQVGQVTYLSNIEFHNYFIPLCMQRLPLKVPNSLHGKIPRHKVKRKKEKTTQCLLVWC